MKVLEGMPISLFKNRDDFTKALNAAFKGRRPYSDIRSKQ
ncbi:MAG: hypothetical protein ACI9AQ_000620 [Dinoroseobacter sp.]